MIRWEPTEFLRDWHGMSSKEMGEKYDCSTASIGSILQKLKKNGVQIPAKRSKGRDITPAEVEACNELVDELWGPQVPADEDASEIV